MTNPRKYFRNNVVGTLNLLDAMLDAGVRDVVFSSTCATYGEPQRVPDRRGPPAGSRSTRTARRSSPSSRCCTGTRGAYGLRYAALRYFNAAGADPDGEIGEDHEPETHLIPLAIEAARRPRGELAIFGTDYPTPDGTAIRDYIHVADLADAHVARAREAARRARRRCASTSAPGAATRCAR